MAHRQKLDLLIHLFKMLLEMEQTRDLLTGGLRLEGDNRLGTDFPQSWHHDVLCAQISLFTIF